MTVTGHASILPGGAVADRPTRIMVVGAHPLDGFERAAGTAAKHLSRGDQVVMVSLTTGVVTHAFNVFPSTGVDKLKHIERVKETKRREFMRAAQILGATESSIFDFSESPMLIGLAEYKALVDLIREFRPDVVLCADPTEVGRHDHMDGGRFVIAAADYARADGFDSALAPHTVPHLFMYYYEDFRSSQLLGSARRSPSVVLDISDVIDVKRATMLEFGDTQAKSGQNWAKHIDAVLAGMNGGPGLIHGIPYVERFVRWNPEVVQYLPIGQQIAAGVVAGARREGASR